MPRQAQLQPVLTLAAAAIRTEVRTHTWIWMILAAFGSAGLIRLIPIPFWTESASLDAVLGANVGIFVITISIASTSDSLVRWAAAAVGSERAVMAPIVGRIAAGTLAGLIAVTAQAALFAASAATRESGVLRFLTVATLLTIWVMITLVPWSVLMRLAVGRAAAPWAVIALAVVAAWLPAEGPARMLRWLLPVLPTETSGAFLRFPTSWAYAIAHAACVTLGTSALMRRMR